VQAGQRKGSADKLSQIQRAFGRAFFR